MSSVTPTKPEASVAGLSLSRVGRLLQSPELYACRECRRLNMVGAVCDCGGTVNQTAREKAEASRPSEDLDDLVEAFELPEDEDGDDDTAVFAPIAYEPCPTRERASIRATPAVRAAACASRRRQSCAPNRRKPARRRPSRDRP